MGNNNNHYISIRILQKFQLNKTDGKRILQEFLKKWRKKMARNMFSQKTKYEF